MGRRGTFWPGARTSLPGSSVAPEGPQEGPPRPAFRAQNALKKHPCGAESRGGGGAPPTHLILLRNQRRDGFGRIFLQKVTNARQGHDRRVRP